MSNKNARERLRAAQAQQAAKKRRNRIIGVGIGVVAVVAIIVTVVVVVQMSNQVQLPEPGQSQTVPGGPPNADADATGIIANPGVAKPGAPVVAIYLDYQCPACNQMEHILGPQFESLASDGSIQLQYRTLTFLDPANKNGNLQSSTRAAIAAACSDSQGVYQQFHDEIFANQPQAEGDGYSDQLLRETIPAKVGLTGTKLTAFQKCYDQRTPEQFVKTVYQNAQRAKILSTPTITVNGHQLDLSKVTDPTKLGAVIQETATAAPDPSTTPVVVASATPNPSTTPVG